MESTNLDRGLFKCVKMLVHEFKLNQDITEGLDGDEAELFGETCGVMCSYNEGNMTEEEYFENLERIGKELRR